MVASGIDSVLCSPSSVLRLNSCPVNDTAWRAARHASLCILPITAEADAGFIVVTRARILTGTKRSETLCGVRLFCCQVIGGMRTETKLEQGR